jgi:hypothetical protein
MGCPDCGPWVRQQKADGYLAKIGATPLYKRIVAGDGWDTTVKRLRRGEVDYLQVPTPDGRRVVLASNGPGELVADNRAEVEAAIAAYPAKGGRNISASKAWQPTSAVTRVEDDDPQGYDFKYLVGVGLEHARQVARDLGLYVGEAGGRGGAAFLLRRPDDPVVWGRFRRWAGVESLEELGRRRAERQARREAAA